ncbi:hypothetical protein [Metabacillus arenae]|uniref:Uncharacterized protein n=1 Tax=Metabacillus arenae TaxID=2771434 RepID=A0A926NL20_9BACI|nr:hypothetical protein [Metabacillus arenae]MBD1379776.1 hypothetical protein [Metabacillus arenae]
MDTYHQKEDVINQFKLAYEQNYLEDFDRRKRRIIDRIYDMEANPLSYQYLLSLSGNQELKRIQVHEHIPALGSAFSGRFTHTIHQFQDEHAKGIELLGRIRTSIEKMFEEEKDIAAIFELR